MQEKHWQKSQEHLMEIETEASKDLVKELLEFIIHRNY